MVVTGRDRVKMAGLDPHRHSGWVEIGHLDLKNFEANREKLRKIGKSQDLPNFSRLFLFFRPKNALKSEGKIPTFPDFWSQHLRSNEHPNPNDPVALGSSSNPDLDFLSGPGRQSWFISPKVDGLEWLSYLEALRLLQMKAQAVKICPGLNV